MIFVKKKDPSCIEVICHDHNMIDLIYARLKGMYRE